MNQPNWWADDVDDRWEVTLQYVRALEESQRSMVERNLRYAWLYDRNSRLMGTHGQIKTLPSGDPFTENMIRSNVETATALVGSDQPRIAFVTDGAEFSVQRRAKWLERYVEAQFHKLDIYAVFPRVVRDACVFGTGAAKVYVDDGELCVERVVPDELIVDEEECRSAPPRQLHQRKFVDRECLKAAYPDFADEIDTAHSEDRRWTSYRRLESSQVAVVESWHLRSSKKARDGRHTITIQGATLFDEEYKADYFPFVFFRWVERITGFYGCGLAEELCGPQLAVNRINATIKKSQELISNPRVFVSSQDAQMKIRMDDEIGAVIPYKGKPPICATWQAVSPELYGYKEQLKADAQKYTGISEMASKSVKPTGLDSGAALREWTDIESQRLSTQKQMAERWFLECARQLLALSRSLFGSGQDTRAFWHSRNLARRIKWSEVDIDEDIYAMRVEAASIMSRTPAGRVQQVRDIAQTGALKPEQILRLTGIPDFERELDIGTAALEDIEAEIENLLDGKWAPPEPFQDLAMGVQRVQRAYLKARQDGAPEDILELLRRWMSAAQSLLNRATPAQKQQAPTAPQMGAVPFQAGLAAPAGVIGDTGGSPPGAPSPNANPVFQ